MCGLKSLYTKIIMNLRYFASGPVDSSRIISKNIKHALHCILFLTLFIAAEAIGGGICFGSSCDNQFEIDPIETYGCIFAILLYLLRILPFLCLPERICGCLGLLFFNAFQDEVQLKDSPLLAPFISIRIVTRGDYPELVRNNVNRNMKTCLGVGLENFLIEVVTEKALYLPKQPRIREIVVPSTYQTKSGALFKARNLQYCLEEDVNVLSDFDWIVHLDEETILTDNSVKGIINFVLDGKHQFGQGLTTFATENVVNWITTLSDNYRVSDDMGRLRFQLKIFHRSLSFWKGSFFVALAGAERKVSFDHGLDGSLTEDVYFSMVACKEGYTFNFIEGEMCEISPLTIWDFVQQRKRWMQGTFLVIHSAAIPLRNKIFLACTFYYLFTLPFNTLNIILARLFPVPCWQIINFLSAFVVATDIYLYIFGAIKSFSLYKIGLFKYTLCIVGVLAIIPVHIVLLNVALIWGVFSKKKNFYVVQKDEKHINNACEKLKNK